MEHGTQNPESKTQNQEPGTQNPEPDTREILLILCAALLLAAAVYAVFVHAPTDRVMGMVQKIFYFHLSCALAAFLSFTTAFAAGIAYLVKRDMKWDHLGAAAVEIGLVFTTLVLVTGMLWGRPVWNAWWTWDPRLTTSLILWFIYASYFILRSSVAQRQRRATYCAVLAIAGFVDVPIVFLSARLWRSIHPVVIKAGSINMEPAMVTALFVSLAAFTALWGVLLFQRTRALALAERIRRVEQLLDRDGFPPAFPSHRGSGRDTRYTAGAV